MLSALPISPLRRRRRSLIAAAALYALACLLVLLIAARPAHAQRRVRLMLGVTVSQQTWSYYGQGLFGTGSSAASSNALAVGIAYDVKAPPVEGSDGRLVLSAYLDHFSYFELFGGNPPSIVGIGMTLRKQQPFFYYGAGVGIYSVNGDGDRSGSNLSYAAQGTLSETTLGGKVFVGLQGRGSLFLEFAATGLASGGLQPGGTVLLGVRL